jgi:hypothetical protein
MKKSASILSRSTLILGLLVAVAAPARAVAAASTPSASAKNSNPMPTARSFMLEALVDFPDDTITAGRALTPRDIDALMAKLAELGIRRVSWEYYGEGHGGYLNPSGLVESDPYQGQTDSQWQYYDATYRLLGNPLKVAVDAGHRHGLEVYGYYKPYETGPGMILPQGTEAARKWGRLDCIGGKLTWMDPFVLANPNLRIQRRMDDLPAWGATARVGSIRLTKKDAAPTRITAEHLQIWTSPDNNRYRPTPAKFAFSDAVEPAPRDVRDQRGAVMTRKGDPVRVLTLSGLNLDDKFILVTTDFSDGKSDFVNSGLALMTALDPLGREIPGVFASGGAIWCASLVDFRDKGLIFDYGWGAAPVVLDAPNTNVRRASTADLPLDAGETNGRQGFIAFARGRNAYLPGALCETEPKVRAFWLKCVDEILATGVDGIDFREENHSTHTDHPEDYGFNGIVVEKARARPGDFLKNVADVRGEAYTEFLRESHRRLAKAGKQMRYNLQIDFFRPNPPPSRLLAYPANIHFDWQRWVDEGLLDGSILRFFSLPFGTIFEDSIAQDMIARSQRRALPITVNRYIETPGEKLSAEVQRVKSDGRFSGFIFYEVSSFIKFGPNPGECMVKYPPVAQAAADAR